jgi:hypothetical protein
MMTPEATHGKPRDCTRCKNARTVQVTVKGVRKVIPCPECRGGTSSGTRPGYMTK